LTLSAPTTSVALCTHNGEKFVVSQLHSVLRQTQPPKEIVVSDDASSDATVRLIRSTFEAHLARNPGVRIVLRVLENKQALGVVANFQQAILSCTSELVALCDQDDVWRPERLARATAAFRRRPTLQLVHSDARLIDEGGAELPETLFEALGLGEDAKRMIRSGNAFDLLMKRNVVTGATAMIRRDLATRATPFPEGWVHDEWLAVVAAVLGEVDLIDERLIDYRQHDRNVIGARRLSFAGKLRRMLEPGIERNIRLLSRAEALVTRLTEMGESVPGPRLAAARRKLLHERARSELPHSRAARFWPVLREIKTGRYGEFGRGALDAARDLLQPLRPLG
jgi:glycosyltransferase involved in cell wall biosynthesis